MSAEPSPSIPSGDAINLLLDAAKSVPNDGAAAEDPAARASTTAGTATRGGPKSPRRSKRKGQPAEDWNDAELLIGLGQISEDTAAAIAASQAAAEASPPATGDTPEGSKPYSKRLRGPPPFAAAATVTAAVLKARAAKKRRFDTDADSAAAPASAEEEQVMDPMLDPALFNVPNSPGDAAAVDALMAEGDAGPEPSQAVHSDEVAEAPLPGGDPPVKAKRSRATKNKAALTPATLDPDIDPALQGDAAMTAESDQPGDVVTDNSLLQALDAEGNATPTGGSGSETPGQGGRGSPRNYLTTEQRKAKHIESEQKRRNRMRLGYAELAALQTLDVNDSWPTSHELLGETRNSTGSVTLLGRPAVKGVPKSSTGDAGGKSKSAVLLRAVSLCKWLEQGNQWYEAEIARLRSGGAVSNDGGADLGPADAVTDAEVMTSLAALGP